MKNTTYRSHNFSVGWFFLGLLQFLFPPLVNFSILYVHDHCLARFLPCSRTEVVRCQWANSPARKCVWVRQTKTRNNILVLHAGVKAKAFQSFIVVLCPRKLQKVAKRPGGTLGSFCFSNGVSLGPRCRNGKKHSIKDSREGLWAQTGQHFLIEQHLRLHRNKLTEWGRSFRRSSSLAGSSHLGFFDCFEFLLVFFVLFAEARNLSLGQSLVDLQKQTHKHVNTCKKFHCYIIKRPSQTLPKARRKGSKRHSETSSSSWRWKTKQIRQLLSISTPSTSQIDRQNRPLSVPAREEIQLPALESLYAGSIIHCPNFGRVASWPMEWGWLLQPGPHLTPFQAEKKKT